MHWCSRPATAAESTPPTGTATLEPRSAAAGFPTLRFHDLRHSAVPLWISMGANLLQVSRWLGHSSVQITADVYGHLFPETNDAVIARLDDALRSTMPEV